MLRARSARRADGLSALHGNLSALENHQTLRPVTSPTGLDPHPSQPVPVVDVAQHRKLTARGRSKARRRQAFTLLVILVPVTFVSAVVLGGWFIVGHLAVDLTLIGYVSWLLRVQRISAEQEMKVAFLPHADAGAEPTVLLESVSSN